MSVFWPAQCCQCTRRHGGRAKTTDSLAIILAQREYTPGPSPRKRCMKLSQGPQFQSSSPFPILRSRAEKLALSADDAQTNALASRSVQFHECYKERNTAPRAVSPSIDAATT